MYHQYLCTIQQIIKNMKYNKSIIISVLALALCGGALQSCEQSKGNKEHSEEAHGHSEGEDEHGHSEGEKDFAEISKKQMQTVGIEVASLEYKALDESIRANGSLSLPKSHKAEVSAVFGGQIKQLLVHSGDKVKRGQTIAYISSPEVIQLQEDYWRAKASSEIAKADYERQETLKKNGGSSEKKFLTAKAEYTSQASRLRALGSKLRLVGINPKNYKEGTIVERLALPSPLTGVIAKVNASVGSFLEASSPLAEVVDNSGLHLELNIYEQDLSKIRLGQTIHFTLTNDPRKEYDATVYSIGSSFEQDSHTIVVHCRLAKVEENFIDGMNITGLVSAGGAEALPVLPEEAIVHNDGKDYAYMLVSEEEAEGSELGHNHEEGEEHSHSEAEHQHKEQQHSEGEKHQDEQEQFYFKPVEVVRGTTELGFTAVHFLTKVPKDAQFVQRGAFFVAAELSEPAGHHH